MNTLDLHLKMKQSKLVLLLLAFLTGSLFAVEDTHPVGTMSRVTFQNRAVDAASLLLVVNGGEYYYSLPPNEDLEAFCSGFTVAVGAWDESYVLAASSSALATINDNNTCVVEAQAPASVPATVSSYGSAMLGVVLAGIAAVTMGRL